MAQGGLFEEGPPVAKVESVARLYRRLVLLIGVQLLAVCGLTALIAALVAGGAAAGGAVEVLSAVVRIALLVAGMVAGYQLARELGESNPGLWAVGMLVPLIILIVLVALSSKANAWCQRAGVKVGLLGPTAESLRRLRESRS